MEDNERILENVRKAVEGALHTYHGSKMVTTSDVEEMKKIVLRAVLDALPPFNVAEHFDIHVGHDGITLTAKTDEGRRLADVANNGAPL